MQKPVFANDHIYHAFNRGVEKRDIFMEDRDYYRFIHSLHEFNSEEPIANLNYYFNSKNRSVEKVWVSSGTEPRKQLVDILVFTLMPNHYHLLMRQKRDNGIVKFMQKLGTGYTNYFNRKYERIGSLFQGRYKAVLVDRESHFIHLPYYIHTNPLDLNYRSSTSIDFLEEYKWSSFLDYVGKRNFPSVTEREFILDIFEGHEKYRGYIIERLKQDNNEHLLNEIRDVIIE